MDGMLEVLRLINALGEVHGRKKLQKLVYILQSRGYGFPEHFGYLHYGPYSSGLAAEVDALVSSGLVSQQGGCGEYEPYVYKSGQAVQKLLRDLGKADKPPWQTLACELNTKDANSLEALSTVLYLISNGFTGKALKDRFSKLKPSLEHLYDKALKSSIALPKA
jgi:uncharacterized protein YwgA